MKKALLVVSFGTSIAETRSKNIEACEQALAALCPDRDFFHSWTSNMVRKKVAERDNLFIDSPQQALERLIELGYRDVAIQSLHIINGDEFEKITRELRAYQDRFEHLTIGKPLLTTFEDYEEVIIALQEQAPELRSDERVVFMGHGTTHPAFAAYVCLDYLFMNKKLPLAIATVDSYPYLPSILQRLKNEGVRRVHLQPFMVVAGTHAIEDMASEEADSWNSLLRAQGIEVVCHMQGLGENARIRALFGAHLLASLKQES